jgi:AGZA family xanthine/uracil permease-like MFS transporter
VQLGDGGNLVGWPIVVFAFGLFLTILLMVKRVKAAILISIIASTVLAVIIESSLKIGPNFIAPDKVNPKGWGLNVPELPEKIVSTPAFSRISVIAAILIVFTLLLADFFDTMGTMTAIGQESGLNDKEGTPPNANKILIVDSIAAAAGGAASISSNTSYIESASGVGEGARTGLASVVTGICFLLTTFLAPLVAIIPYEAATPALVIVGFLMMTGIKDIDWSDLGIAIPGFLTIILMPFTYNITVGIGAGFVTHVIIRLFQGQSKKIHPLLWIVSALFMVYFLSSPINTWVG